MLVDIHSRDDYKGISNKHRDGQKVEAQVSMWLWKKKGGLQKYMGAGEDKNCKDNGVHSYAYKVLRINNYGLSSRKETREEGWGSAAQWIMLVSPCIVDL